MVYLSNEASKNAEKLGIDENGMNSLLSVVNGANRFLKSKDRQRKKELEQVFADNADIFRRKEGPIEEYEQSDFDGEERL